MVGGIHHPYYIFLDAGAKITLATPNGGLPPIDPRSLSKKAQTASTIRFSKDEGANQALANTVKLSAVHAGDFNAIFYPDGHGPLWDLATDSHSIRLIEEFWAQGKPVSAVCHAPIVLLHANDADGNPLVKNKAITGFSNTEEQAVGLTEKVPMLLETELISKGAVFSKADDFQPHVRVDGNLITGQNPASAEGIAHSVIELIRKNVP